LFLKGRLTKAFDRRTWQARLAEIMLRVKRFTAAGLPERLSAYRHCPAGGGQNVCVLAA